ncbi:acyl carrier protein [Neoaquamicrobium sediminum]|uniref:acyl carrier protein n=1 Tax=Neoaquamicrobium sediminum TaxID=1849104 RepID=UPI001567C53F|nr:acyl carrier protein [Mesorhizobium sediminum]NRC54175.1 acyl carrier protein [Mesorhizobium sediminum]
MRSITKEIIEHVQRFYGDPVGVTVTQETPIDELQIDSLDRTELVIHVEREFGVTVPDEKWDECTTVGLLIAAAVDARRAATDSQARTLRSAGAES